MSTPAGTGFRLAVEKVTDLRGVRRSDAPASGLDRPGAPGLDRGGFEHDPGRIRSCQGRHPRGSHERSRRAFTTARPAGPVLPGGLLVEVIGPLGLTTSCTRDPFGRLKAITDPLGHHRDDLEHRGSPAPQRARGRHHGVLDVRR
ncbi:RHS repeat domain-containing protein [Streptomyces sp. LN699]|uniref:RHS repeat domain-containing protein n=1 Tax=Streptomyces sp. LN699 TaxID=3112981 RepID=UPI00371B2C91